MWSHSTLFHHKEIHGNMCGIVGIISRQGTLSYYCADLFTNMLRMDSVRGPDSTGCFGISSGGKVDMLKGDTDGWKFTTTTHYGNFKKRIDRNYKVVIGHNRKATSGSVKASNAHPFQEKHIMLVHNGAIKNAKDMAETEVDSHAIAHALAEHDPVTALGKLDGAYAIVWYDGSDKTISLARNKERPLFLLEYPFMWVVASEPGLPMWLNGREDRKPDKVMMVPTEQILTFNLDNLSKGFYEIPYEEFKMWRKPISPSSTRSEWPRTATTAANEPLPVFRNTNNTVVDLTPTRSSKIPYKPKDTIHFVLDDTKIENGAEILLGFPIINGVVDKSIFVRTVLKKGDDAMKYFGVGKDAFKNEEWKGTIQHIRPLCGISTVYIHELEPVFTIKDVQNSTLEEAEVKEALKDGCSRCHAAMTLVDVPKSIVRKKTNGKWRIVCEGCLKVAQMEAIKKQPGVTLRARTH